MSVTREDFVRAMALVDGLIDPPMRGKYGRYADAVMDVLNAQERCWRGTPDCPFLESHALCAQPNRNEEKK